MRRETTTAWAPEPTPEQLRARQERLEIMKYVAIRLPLMVLAAYIALGLIRMFDVMANDNPSIRYEPWLDYWWKTMLTMFS